MGRTRTKVRKRGNHSEDAMKKAMKLVHSGTSIRKASKDCNLCYATVRRYVAIAKMNPGQNIRLTPNYEVNAVFTLEEENKLQEYIEYCSQVFYGLCSKDCRRIAFQMAKTNQKKIPPSWMATEMAGIEWLRSFKKRHPEISLRKPEACSIARATAFNQHNVEKFFGNLKSAMERHTNFADGTRIFNLDETATTTVQRPGRVLARKGTNVSKVTSGERGTLVTTCCIVGAAGQALPPAMVFPRKKFKPHMTAGAPPGTLGLASASGWMNAELFVEVMKHFIKHVSASKENPVLLIMDNHESHLSIDAIELARSSGVTILTLHPHTTAKLQPLDVGLNGPFKAYYNAAVDSWLLRNPGQPLTIYNIAQCVGPAYQKAMTPVNITNAFKKCGIFPFDDCIFTDVDFMQSTVTDRPLIETANMVQGENNERDASRISIDSDVTEFDDDHRMPSPSLMLLTPAADVSNPMLAENEDKNVEGQHNPSTSQDETFIRPKDITPPKLSAPSASASTSTTFISPMEFMPPIKAKPRNPNRYRTPGRSMIATDTPEKNAIALKQKNPKKKQTKTVKQDLFTDDAAKKKTVKKKEKATEQPLETSDEEEFIASGSSSGGEGFISENEEDEEEKNLLDGNFLPLDRNPREGEFVVVIFPLKKNSVYYVAKILEIIENDDCDADFYVSFLRLKSKTRETFSNPIVPDIAALQKKDIKYILPDPKIIGTTRRHASFSFGVDMSKLKLR